jgi:deoxycytidylate deaminase
VKDWDEYFINLAGLVAQKSKDPSTKVGCVIVGPDHEIRTTGFNGFPRGVREVTITETHLPTEVQYEILSQDLTARCSCGKTIKGIPPPSHDQLVGLHKPMYDIQMEIAANHKHFTATQSAVLMDRWERPAKYDWVEHAERNAVYNAARMGTALKGCTAYLNWEPHPCLDCTKAFIQAGISEVVGPNIPFTTNRDWKFELGQVLMDEAGLTYREVPWDVE